MVGGRCPIPSEICTQSDPLPFEKRRLRQVSAYNVSIVRDSEKRSIMTNRKSITGSKGEVPVGVLISFGPGKEIPHTLKQFAVTVYLF